MNTCYNPFSLERKNILVTGASGGIGRAVAIECSRMGAILTLTGRNKNNLEETYRLLQGEGHQYILADLCKEEDCQRICDKIHVIDGFVNCTGISIRTPIQFATPDKVQHIFNTNFFSVIELIRLMLKKKKLEKGSSVVMISSVGGVTSFDVTLSMYGASKAALVSWMRLAAKELSAKKIRVNCVCPGMTHTAMTAPGTFSADQLMEDERRYPLGRYGEAKEIAWSVIYLLSDATAWVTGTNLIIDGGISLC